MTNNSFIRTMYLTIKGLIAFIFLFPLFPIAVSAQPSADPLPPGYYIVVASYRLNQNSYAENYIRRINGDDVSLTTY